MDAVKNPYDLSEEFDGVMDNIVRDLRKKNIYPGQLDQGYSCPGCQPQGWYVQHKHPRKIAGIEIPFSDKKEIVLFVAESFVGVLDKNNIIEVLMCDELPKVIAKSHIENFADSNGYKVSWLTK